MNSLPKTRSDWTRLNPKMLMSCGLALSLAGLALSLAGCVSVVSPDPSVCALPPLPSLDGVDSIEVVAYIDLLGELMEECTP